MVFAAALLTLGLLTPVPTTYATFFVLQGASSGNTIVDAQLQGEVKMALADKERVETSPELAEAVVVVHVATPEKHSRDAFYDGWGGWSWQIGGPATYKVGSVVVDIFDARTKRLLWDGSAVDVLAGHAAGSEEHVRKDVAKLFASFPLLENGGVVPTSGSSENTSDGHDIPRIIFSSMPAVVVRIDGEPRYENIAGTDLQRVVNTNAVIVRDAADMHYLKMGDDWMEAEGVLGGWSRAGMLPDGVKTALATATTQGQTPLASSGDAGQSPIVFVATTPADLIITNGEPEFTHYNGTSLLYVKNTKATVFKEPTDQELYVHLTGGWYRAWSANGPWERIGDEALPADLVQIKAL